MPQQVKKSLVLSIYFALAVSALLVFWQVRNFSFINYDDNFYVYENPHVLNGLTAGNITWAFTTGSASFWHPLTWLSLMLDRQLFGPNAAGFHLVNLFFHIANTLILFLVLRQMTQKLWQSAFVAALFALHPLHVESVAWIAERKDVLSTFFWLLTMSAYWQYVKKPGIVRYLLTLLIFALGLMAKPMLVTLPFVFLLLDYWPLYRIKHFDWQVIYRLVFEKIPFIVLSIASSVIAFLTQQSNSSISSFAAIPLKFRIGNALISYVKYIEKLFLPTGLAAFYPHPFENVSVVYAVISAGVLLAVTILVLRFAKNHRYLVTGWFWYLGTLLPVIGIIQVGSHAMADRYSYITLTGLFIIIAFLTPQLLSRLPHRKIALGISMLTALTALGISAQKQTMYWNNSTTLFSHALAVTNNNFLAHSCLGQELYKQGKLALAVEHLNKALQINPNYTNAIINLGCVSTDRGYFIQAIDYFQKALQLKPDSVDALTNLGTALLRQGKLKEAIIHIRRSLQIEPDNPATINNLAWLFATCSDPNYRNPAEAIRLAQQACHATAYVNPETLDTLAAAFASAGRFNEAVITAQKALNLANENNKQISGAIKSHLDLYNSSKPLIEKPQM